MFGDIVKVTPSSKVVGDMALMMVSQDLTVADVENPAKDIAFPDSVVSMLKGDLGQPPGGWPQALQKKALKGEAPYTAVPGSLLAPADLAAERKVIEDKLERKIDDFEFASYLMYPKVFTDFALASDTYGPVSVLPTHAYFYGLKDGEELFADIERGKTLVVVKADIGNAAHLGAPMPGVISRVFATTGQAVKAGDVLLSIEAMKMETALHAEKDGTIAEVLVKAGDQIDAKDLLIVYGKVQ
ncbi:Pyruvate carboxylase (plasmid) [Neorhizobium galegae bv. orientalis str. HAMBI 540]|uniref:Pyruvate carboxylase n=1 Tax=Neorhizobium galegae bv. orientalis str. HAMBI 540 TaxID=1028800 RepID=A0A068T015_NEOGA|nr:Pyruvate carboxylase [Neorhizobium galegae bv. orientalis str. HAMBI 540]